MRGRQTVDQVGEFGVALGDALGVVGDEAEANFVIADVDVGMMVLLLGEIGDVVDEGHGVDEVGKNVVADEFAVVKVPVWELLEDFVEFGWGESFHGDCLRSVAEGYPLPPLSILVKYLE